MGKAYYLLKASTVYGNVRIKIVRIGILIGCKISANCVKETSASLCMLCSKALAEGQVIEASRNIYVRCIGCYNNIRKFRCATKKIC